MTVNNNLLALDVEKNYLAPFVPKRPATAYVGLGKMIDATVRFAAYTNSEKVIALKKRLVDEIIKTQDSDGYIGMLAVPNRMWSLWDLHEMGYIIYGLTSDYHYFGEKRSLEAARKVADYILRQWSTMPPEKDWNRQSQCVTHHASLPAWIATC